MRTATWFIKNTLHSNTSLPECCSYGYSNIFSFIEVIYHQKHYLSWLLVWSSIILYTICPRYMFHLMGKIIILFLLIWCRSVGLCFTGPNICAGDSKYLIKILNVCSIVLFSTAQKPFMPHLSNLYLQIQVPHELSVDNTHKYFKNFFFLARHFIFWQLIKYFFGALGRGTNRFLQAFWLISILEKSIQEQFIIKIKDLFFTR